MKIKSVKRVQVDPTPVFDLTVTGTENFKLEAGPYVHNSKDVADAMAGVVFGLTTRREVWGQHRVPLMQTHSLASLIRDQKPAEEQGRSR